MVDTKQVWIWLPIWVENKEPYVAYSLIPWPLEYGAPKLFNIYMKQLGGAIQSFGVRCHRYADDIQV